MIYSSSRFAVRVLCILVLFLTMPVFIGNSTINYLPFKPQATESCSLPEPQQIDFSHQQANQVLDERCGLVPMGAPYPLTNYSIEAQLDPVDHTVRGNTTITYVNHADISLSDLVFHLYPNAFRPHGNITINWVRHIGANLSYTISGSDLTVLTVDLVTGPGPGPILPSYNLTLDLNYLIHVPNLRDRFGWWSTTAPEELLAYNLGNWHPIVAVYDSRGWHTAPYTFIGESFYSDVAVYSVNLTAPEDYIVAATGELQSITSNNGKATWYWTSGSVRDFTWCASPHYQTSSILVNGINVTSYHAAGHDLGGQRVLQVAQECLTHYSALFGPYTWPSLRIVETDFWAGGMEYPQLVMIYHGYYENPTGLSNLATVVAHEIGHEWIPFSIGTDSNTEPWIDEGFATFTEMCWVEYAYGATQRQTYRQWKLDSYWNFVQFNGDECINRSVPYWETHPGYGAIVYQKAALVYDLLRIQLGSQSFYQAWRDIYNQILHQNIRARDLQLLFEEVVNGTLDWFFDQWVFGSDVVTLSLRSATVTHNVTGWVIDFQLRQVQTSPVALNVPIQVGTTEGTENLWVWMDAAQLTNYTICIQNQPQWLILDPDDLLLCQYNTKAINFRQVPLPPLHLIVAGILIIGVVGFLSVTLAYWWVRTRQTQ